MAKDSVPVTTPSMIQSPPPTFRQLRNKEPVPQTLPSMGAKLSHLLEKSPLTAPAKVHSIHGERRVVSTSKQNRSALHPTSMPHTGHTHSSKRPAMFRNGNARELAIKKLKSKKAPIPQARDLKMTTEKFLAVTEGLGRVLLHEMNVTMQGMGLTYSAVTTSSPELSTTAKHQQVTHGRTSMKRPLKHGFSESPTENRKNISVGSLKPQHSRLPKNKSIIQLPSDLSDFELPNIAHVNSNVTFPAILLEKETGLNSHIVSERLKISTTDAAEATKTILGEQGVINSTEKMTLTSQGDRNNDISRPLLFKEPDTRATGETRPAHAEGDSKVLLKTHDLNQSRRSNFSSTAIPIQPDSITKNLPVKLTSARPEIDIETLTQVLQLEKGSSNQALEEVQSNTQPGLGSTKLRIPGNTSVQTETQTKAGSGSTTVNPRKIHIHSQAHRSVTNHRKPKQRSQQESEIYNLTQPIITSIQPATHQHDTNKQLHLGQGSKAQTDPNIKTDTQGQSVTSKGAHKRAHQYCPTTKTDIMLSSMLPTALHDTTTKTSPVLTTAALLGTHWLGTPIQTEPGKVNMTQSGIGRIDSNTTAHTQSTSSIQEHLTPIDLDANIIGSHSVITETLPLYSIAGQATDRLPELVSHTKPVGSDWFTPTLSANSEPELSTIRQTTKSRLEPSSNRQPDLSTNRQPELSSYSPPETTTKGQPELSKWSQQELSTNRQPRLSNKSQPELSTASGLEITTQNHQELYTHNHFMSSTETQSELSTLTQTEVSTNNQPALSTQKELETSTKSNTYITASQSVGSEISRTKFSTNSQTTLSSNSHPLVYTVELSRRSQLELTTKTQSELPKISQTERTTTIQPKHSKVNIPELFTQNQPGVSSPWHWDPSTKSQIATDRSTQSHQDLTIIHDRPELSTQSLPKLYTYNKTKSSTKNNLLTTIALQTPPEEDLSTEIGPRLSPGRTEPSIETTSSHGTEPYSFTENYSQLSTLKNRGSQPELATQTASLGQTHKTTKSKTQLFTETQPGLTTQNQGESSVSDEQTNTGELMSAPTSKTQITSTQHGPKWQTGLIIEARTTSSKASETQYVSPATSVTVKDSHANVSETAWNGRNSSHSSSFTWDSGINPTWTHEDTSKSTSNVLPTTANGFLGNATTEDDLTIAARSGQGQIAHVSHTVQLNTSLQMKTTTLTPHSLSDRGPGQPGMDRIFIVDEQLPVFKVEAINVTYRMQLNLALSALCDQPDTCQTLLLQEVTSVYKAVPGFDRIEVQNITSDRTLEYRVQLRVETGSAMSDTLELALSDPTWLFGVSHRSEDSLTSRVRSVSMAQDHADPCKDWLSCPLGFRCLSGRSLGSRCHSPCHSGFCHNRGICVHRKEQEPECQCPVGRDFWYMGQTCDYRMTHQRLTAIACAIVLCIIICAAAVVYILVRRFQTQILQHKLAQTQSRLETSGSSINDLMIDSGKASDASVSSWPMEPIHWTPFPILHQLSLQSPFHARRPHSYFEGMELVNTERSWTA